MYHFMIVLLVGMVFLTNCGGLTPDEKLEINVELNKVFQKIIKHIDRRIDEATRKIEEETKRKFHTEALLLSQLKSEQDEHTVEMEKQQGKMEDYGIKLDKKVDKVKYIGDNTSNAFGRDCATLRKCGYTWSDEYVMELNLPVVMTKEVLCDMTTDGGGWTVIQKRINGDIDFNNDWQAYKHGFGYNWLEFWLGNEAIHFMTMTRPHMLRVDLWDKDGNMKYAQYDNFYIRGEQDGYRLGVSGYSGTAGDAMTGSSDNMNGQRFSTKDRDNDTCGGNCATYHGGWWHKCCTRATLNKDYQNMNWHTGSSWLKVVHSEMKIRPRDIKP